MYKGIHRHSQGYIQNIAPNPQYNLNKTKRHSNSFAVLRDGLTLSGRGKEEDLISSTLAGITGEAAPSLLSQAGSMAKAGVEAGMETYGSAMDKYNMITETLDTVKGLGIMTANLYSSKPATMVKNYLIAYDKNPNARQSYAGEHHMIIPTTAYGYSMANYCG